MLQFFKFVCLFVCCLNSNPNKHKHQGLDWSSLIQSEAFISSRLGWAWRIADWIGMEALLTVVVPGWPVGTSWRAWGKDRCLPEFSSAAHTPAFGGSLNSIAFVPSALAGFSPWQINEAVPFLFSSWTYILPVFLPRSVTCLVLSPGDTVVPLESRTEPAAVLQGTVHLQHDLFLQIFLRRANRSKRTSPCLSVGASGRLLCQDTFWTSTSSVTYQPKSGLFLHCDFAVREPLGMNAMDNVVSTCLL